MTQVDITDAQVTVLVEVDGLVCLTRMDKDKYDAVAFLVKKSLHDLVKTEITQDKLNRLLMPGWFD